jgi:hypothetical protein
MMSPLNSKSSEQKSTASQADLVDRYHRIGISAVAGALEYGNGRSDREAAPGPVERRIKERELQVSA